MLPHEPVRRTRGSGRLAQRCHVVCLLALSGLTQLTLCLVACSCELLRRECIQAIGDLVHAHHADFHPLTAYPARPAMPLRRTDAASRTMITEAMRRRCPSSQTRVAPR